MRIRLHAFEPASRANGPGLRAAVWLQGCALACPGCFNPGTHDPSAGYEADVESLVQQILAAPGIEGVSISGGEPFQQPGALAELVARLRETPVSILIFSGYPMEVARARPKGAEILANTDVLVAGPYVQERHVGFGLLGSANQRLHLLTGRYCPADFSALPASEVILHRDGSVTVTGFRHFPALR
jgi:anaerobic ribonucleoside-triphosphate reductase activating protein